MWGIFRRNRQAKEIRLVLSSIEFDQLIRGGEIRWTAPGRHVPVRMIMSDIGYNHMIEKIERARAERGQTYPPTMELDA